MEEQLRYVIACGILFVSSSVGLQYLQDVDFIINTDSAPEGVKKRLLNLPNSPFIQQAQFFFYKNHNGSYIQVDITPGRQVRPYTSILPRILAY